MKLKFEIDLEDVDQVLDTIDPRLIERYLRKKKLENCLNPTELPPLELNPIFCTDDYKIDFPLNSYQNTYVNI